jgi:O-antigen/teichoic acid export membrane protein
VPRESPGAPDATAPGDAAAATTSRSVLRGGAWYTASYAVPQVYTAITSIIAARVLGKADFGQQSFIALNSILIATLLSSSMFLAVMRYVGETVGAGRPQVLRSLLGWAWKVNGIAAAIAAAILIVVALAGGEPPGAWAIAGLVSGLTILHTVPTAVLVGLQRIRQASTVGLTTGFFSTIATALVLWAGGGITGMFAVELVVVIGNLAWTGTLARRALGPGDPGAAAEARALQRRVAHFAFIAALGVLVEQIVASRVEFFFLKAFSTTDAIALYTIAFSMVVALRMVPSALGATVAPAFATLFGAGHHDRIRSGFMRALRLIFVITLPLAAAAFALGPALVDVVYGVQYTGVAQPLRIMVLVFPLAAASSLSGAHLAALGRVRVTVVANAIAAAVDIGLALVFVPTLDASGAAIANSGGQLTYAIAMLAVSATALGSTRGWRLWSLIPSVLASALAAVGSWAALEAVEGTRLLFGVIAGAVAFVVLYGAAAAALGVLTDDDARWLEATVGGRLGHRIGSIARYVTIRSTRAQATSG